jgi:hypothetical protein
MVTGGQVPDCIAADELLDQLVSADILHGDKGYDRDAVRRKIESKGAAPNIPPKANRRWKSCFSPYLYTSIASETRSNACSAGLRTFAASRRDTIASPATSSPQSPWPLPSATGYESGA